MSVRQPPKIGVFDSGVGGLSILQSLRHKLPGPSYHYCCDNLNFPYGTKTDEQVVRFTLEAVVRFASQYALDMLIVACNTASTVSLPSLRAAISIPVVGVVPAIKPAALTSQTRTIALLATPGTVRRPYTDELINGFALHCRVLKTGSSALVELAERKLRGEAIDLAAVHAEIMPMFLAGGGDAGSRLDTVVLGCTHFPLLQAELTAVAPWPVTWIDSSEAIAKRAAYLLEKGGFILGAGGAEDTKANDSHTMSFACTRHDDGIEALAPALRRLGFGVPQVLS